MMLMIYSAFMLRYFPRRSFLISLVIVVVFTAPRVMIGAHWFTDIAVGSLSVVLVALSWWLISPASDAMINFCIVHYQHVTVAKTPSLTHRPPTTPAFWPQAPGCRAAIWMSSVCVMVTAFFRITPIRKFTIYYIINSYKEFP